MENLNFSEEEIEDQLALLGYRNIPKHRLREFKRDLDQLILHGDWKNLASPAQVNGTKPETSRPSPPAYTKEKVSRFYCEEDVGEGFFLHAGPEEHDRPRRDGGRLQGRCDSYARHSVAPRLRLPPGAPGRLQVEPDPDPDPNPDDSRIHPPLTDSCTSSPGSPGRCFIKRKVLRKHNGRSLVCDESIYSEDSDAASCLEDRLAELRLSPPARRDYETDYEDATSPSEAPSSEAFEPLSAFESYIRGMTRAQSDGDMRPKPKSFIRPVMNQQTRKKTDPVAKYFQYKQLWEMFKLPGETDRRGVRLDVRERLAYQPPPPKPRRVYRENTYVVPTDKKRSALRWEIRSDLANGLLPSHKFSYRF